MRIKWFVGFHASEATNYFDQLGTSLYELCELEKEIQSEHLIKPLDS